MPIKRVSLCFCLLAALWLVACSSEPLGKDVIRQAEHDGQIAFDVVKIDDAVVKTLEAQPKPAFEDRFKKYVPPPELKIAVGDIVAVVIWESAANGLFGNSITELAFPAGTAARLRTGQVAPGATGFGLPGGVTASSGTLGLLLGVAPDAAAGQNAATAASQTTAAASATAAANATSGALSSSAAGLLGGLSSEQSAALLAGLSTGSLAALPAGASGALQALGQQVAGSANAGLATALTGLRGQQLEQLINLAAQSGRPGTLIPDQLVGPDGTISIPYAGRIEVAGLTASEVQHRIEQRLGPKALDPQALVMVRLSPSNSVSVAGEAIGGKRIPLSPGGDRLLQVIAAAGGARGAVHETYVRLSRDGVTATVPLATLVADPKENIFAEPGDVLTLVRRPKTYSVFGATTIGASGKNSAINFLSDRLSLSEALARAGGLLDEKADPQSVFLFRYEPESVVKALGQPIATAAPRGVSPIVYRLDLREAKSYLLAKQFDVHDKDIIFVANAESVPIYRFFAALSKVAGPVETALITCHYSKNC